jgi:hypothetical protein
MLKNLFFKALFVAGFIVILGAAGSSDFGQADILTSVIRCAVGLALGAAGYFGLWFSGWNGFYRGEDEE